MITPLILLGSLREDNGTTEIDELLKWTNSLDEEHLNIN